MVGALCLLDSVFCICMCGECVFVGVLMDGEVKVATKLLYSTLTRRCNTCLIFTTPQIPFYGYSTRDI